MKLRRGLKLFKRLFRIYEFIINYDIQITVPLEEITTTATGLGRGGVTNGRRNNKSHLTLPRVKLKL